MSYAEQVYQGQGTQVAPRSSRQRSRPVMPSAPPIVTIPDEIVKQSLMGYDQNQLAQLLVDRFGVTVANRLLRQFEIGTSSYWPGACVFWLRDHYQRVRGGQVVLFDEHGHTAKQQRPDGTTRRCTSWVHTALAHAYSARHEVPPAWLDAYQAQEVEKSPCLLGLAQLATTEFKKPIMVVESPKTAVICAGFYPQYVWLAVNALSYLTLERLAPLKGRPVTLFPDASVGGRAFALWQAKAAQFKLAGFNLSVSDYLEQHANEAQKAAGLDLADVLLADELGYPPSWDEKE